MAFDRASLINGLANEFKKDEPVDLSIDKSNFISESTHDCTARAIPVDDLRKTRNVLLSLKEKFKVASNQGDNMATQNLLHIENSIKCVEEVISLNSK